MPVSSRFARNSPSISHTVGKFWTPAKPMSLHYRSSPSTSRKVSVAQTPASNGVPAFLEILIVILTNSGALMPCGTMNDLPVLVLLHQTL